MSKQKKTYVKPKRKTGYYHVKWEGIWEVAYFENRFYLSPAFASIEDGKNEEEFDEINETRIKNPDEK